MTAIETLTAAKIIRGTAFVFTQMRNAISFSHGTTKPSRIMLGDFPQIWVVSPADASRLERAGYDYAC